jgi:hypothetical protein
MIATSVFLLLSPPLLPVVVIHRSIITIVIIHFGIARCTPRLIGVFFIVQYAVFQASVYFLYAQCQWCGYQLRQTLISTILVDDDVSTDRQWFLVPPCSLVFHTCVICVGTWLVVSGRIVEWHLDTVVSVIFYVRRCKKIASDT